ncbi:hypothetical protein C0991_005229, partial [Blastosporella zonata]
MDEINLVGIPDNIPHDIPDGMDDLQLLYPESEEQVVDPPPPDLLLRSHHRSSSEPRSHHKPIPHPEIAAPRPRLLSQTVDFSLLTQQPPSVERLVVSRPASKSASRPTPQSTSKSTPTPNPPPVKLGQMCVTPECQGILPVESTASRCVSCVKKEWMSKVQVSVDPGPSRPHKRRKTVTWEDTPGVRSGANVNGREGDEVKQEDSADGPVASTSRIAQPPKKLKIRIPALWSPNESVAPSQPSSEVPPVVDSATDVSEHKETSFISTTPSPQPRDSPETSAASSRNPQSTSFRSPPPIKDSTSSPPNVSQSTSPALTPKPHAKLPYSEPTAEEGLHQTTSGWDSDLTDLGNLSDLASEASDSSSSSEPLGGRSSLKIRIPARSVPQAEVGPRICTIPKCHRVLDEGYRWKCCVQCRLHHREYQRKRQNIQGRQKRFENETGGATDTPFISRPPTSSQALDFVPPPSKPPLDLLTPGARLCTIKNCTHIIPAPEEYAWKMCEPCRVRTRNNQRRRRKGMITGEAESKDSGTQAEPGSRSESEDVFLVSGMNPIVERSVYCQHNVVEQANMSAERGASIPESPRLCKRQDCGIIINPKSQDSLCNQCRARRSQRKARPVRPSPSRILFNRDVAPPKKTIPPHAKYVCWSTLLDLFHKRIAGFLEAHQFYQRFKQSSQATEPIKKATFKFEGEYSVIALDFDVIGKKAEVYRQTVRLKDDIGRIGGLAFLPTYCVTTLQDEEGIAVRFECHVRSSKMVEMKGKLEIA